MKFCTHCGALNHESANYCIHDGHPLEKRPFYQEKLLIEETQINCTYCGADYFENSTYCYICGEEYSKIKVKQKEVQSNGNMFNQLSTTIIKSSLLKSAVVLLLTFAFLLLASNLMLKENITDSYNYYGEEDDNHKLLYLLLDRFRDFENARRIINRFEIDEEQLTEQFISPIDVILLGNKAELKNSDESFQMSREVGVSSYLIIVILSISLAFILCRKWYKNQSFSELIVNSLIFSICYSLGILLITLYMNQHIFNKVNQDYFGFGNMSISYDIPNLLWKSLLIGFISATMIMLFINKRKLPNWVNGIKLAFKTYIYLLIVFIIIGSFYLYKINDHFTQVESNSFLVNSIVFIGMMAIIIFKIALLIPFQFNVNYSSGEEMIDEKYFFHLISNNIEGGPMQYDLLYWLDLSSYLNQFNIIFWSLLIFSAFIILINTRSITKTIELKSKLLTVLSYSVTFAIIGTLLSYSTSSRFSYSYNVDEHVVYQFQGFSPLISFGVLSVLTFVISFISILLFRNRN